MRRTTTLMLAFGLSAILAGSAQAQRPGGGGRGMGMMGGPMIAGNPQVQEELKLSDEQVSQVTEALEAAREKMGDLRGELEGVAPEERMAKMRELMAPINKEISTAMDKVLKPEQKTRLQQIELQMDARMRGVEALLESRVSEGLKLTEEQVEKLKGLATDMNTKRRDIMQDAQGDFQGAMQKFNTLREETMTKVMTLMSDDQKSAWKDMVGETFEMRFGRGPTN